MKKYWFICLSLICTLFVNASHSANAGSLKNLPGLHDKTCEIALLNNMNIRQEAMGQNASARDYDNKAGAPAAELADSSVKERLLINQGNILMGMGKFSEAKSALNKGIRLARKSGAKDEQLRGMQAMSELLYKQGKYQEAYNYLKHTLRIEASPRSKRLKQVIDSGLAKNDLKPQDAKIQYVYKVSPPKSYAFPRSSAGLVFLVILGFITGLFSVLFYTRRKRNATTTSLLKEKDLEIEKLENELKLQNTTKDKLFSIIANDLRKSFTAVLGFADILTEDYENIDEQDKILYIRAIHSSTFNIYELLKSLHNWSQTQTGTLQCHPTLVDLSQLTEQNVELFASYARSKNIRFDYDITGEAVAYADRNMVSTAISNLLNNAIKYTNKGGEVHVTVHDVDHSAVLSVTDTGRGIAENELERLFQPGQPNRTRGTADESGTGLGLILCKEYISLNKGTIRAESALGKGSRFTISLPARCPESVQ